MTSRRLVELWEPPEGLRLASATATTYELQADFLEEDLLPTALGLRLPPARGRDFRLELERALQDCEISVFFHPGRYQPGLRKSPRIDLVALPEGRFPKPHAKIALLRFIAPSKPDPEDQVVRLIVGSPNLTNSGYRSNIEIATLVDDAPGGSPEAATVVRDALDWLEQVVRPSTAQVRRQFRDMRAVFARRPTRRQDDRVRFIGLPGADRFPPMVVPDDRITRLTIASPFWPSGKDLSDVAGALSEMCGGRLKSVRLIGTSDLDEAGDIRPVIPAGLVRSLLANGANVEVSAAEPTFGCETIEEEAETEFDEVAERRGSHFQATRALHAKAILAEGETMTRFAMGSFNLTRKGLHLGTTGNVEAGLLWTLPNAQSGPLRGSLPFASAWIRVDRAPEEFVLEPDERDGEDPMAWPDFLISVRATSEVLTVEGDAQRWPDEVVVRMRDIRSRLLTREEWFDPWTIRAPDTLEDFTVSTTLQASWLVASTSGEAERWTALPDLEAEVAWGDNRAIVPVLFEDKHFFPVAESVTREDEQSLIAWFLGLRPLGEVEDGGFGHSIDPLPNADESPSLTSDILSYLVRDFVHALPGIRHRLTEAGVTESGLRAALLGHRSPVQLAQQAVEALREPRPDRPRKTVLATAFQLKELLQLLEEVPLPELAEGATEVLRADAISAVASSLATVIAELPAEDATEIVRAYLGGMGGRT